MWRISARLVRHLGGDRIFSLAAYGERATAQYHPRVEPDGHDAVYRLVQLRGPFNRDASPRMQAFAHEIEALLNAPERRDKRMAALQAHARLAESALQWRRAQQQAAAWLDAKTLRQLAAVIQWLDLTPLGPQMLLCDHIAGYGYHDGPAIEDGLREGDALALVREPDNPHDPLAVRLDWREYKLGYLPRPANADIAMALDAGERLAACIRRIDRGADPWERVEVTVQAL